jgi:hypothetical protein
LLKNSHGYRPGWELVAFYEERFNADGQLWAVYIETVAGPRPRQRSGEAKRSGYPLPGDASTFVADITPDGTVMPPGFRFEKIWRIQNSGTVPWAGRWLRRLGPPAGLGIPSSPLQVPIATTMPGETVDITVPMRAHNLAGTAEVHWKWSTTTDTSSSLTAITGGYLQRSPSGKARPTRKFGGWDDSA